VRDELREWLRSLHEQLHVTSLFVTHDQVEAMELADDIVVMGDGQVIQTGAPDEIVNSPNSAFVMNFLGRSNALQGSASHGVADIHGLKVPFSGANGTTVPVMGYFRPNQVGLSLEPTGSSLPVRVTRVLTTGSNVKVTLETADAGVPVLAEIDNQTAQEMGLQAGTAVYATPWNLQVYGLDGAKAAERELEAEPI
jgi:sulfate transport system ATP-binding protein